MAIIFPNSWSLLRFQNLRSDLILLLQELGDADYQIKINSDDPYKQFDIDEIFHFFFDDTDLFKDSNSCIGDILFDNKEAELISLITKTLNEILSDLGNQNRFSYVEHPLWAKVIELSKIALAEFERKGVPTFTD